MQTTEVERNEKRQGTVRVSRADSRRWWLTVLVLGVMRVIWPVGPRSLPAVVSPLLSSLVLVTMDDVCIEEVSHEPAGLDDFIAGTFAGVALTLVGHPFDTVKVRLQTQPTLYKTGTQCLKDTVRKEGFFALYKGMGGPMLTVPLVNAIVFAAYGQAKSVMHKLQPVDVSTRQAEAATCKAH